MKYTLILFLSLLSLQISAQETQNPEAVLVTPEQKTEFLRIRNWQMPGILKITALPIMYL